MSTDKIKEKKKYSKATLVANYIVVGGIIYLVYAFIGMFLFALFGVKGDLLDYCVISPIAVWFSSKHSARRLIKMAIVDTDITKASVVTYVILNVVGTALIRFIQPTVSIYYFIGVIIAVVVFYLISKKEFGNLTKTLN